MGDGLLGLAALIGFGLLAPVEWTWWRLGYVVAAVVGGGLVETAIQAAIGSLAVRGGVARTMQVQADQTVTTVGIYLLTIFWPQDLLFLCFIFPLGFVVYLPTTALCSAGLRRCRSPHGWCGSLPGGLGAVPPVPGAVPPHVATPPEPGA